MADRVQGEEDLGNVNIPMAEIDIYSYHEQYAGRLVLDPKFAFIQ